MTTATQIAKLILATTDQPMHTVKLQKLVYYCQAWHTTALDRPLFDDSIQAWEHGPVVPQVWHARRGYSSIAATDLSVDVPEIDALSVQVVDAVLAFYGSMSAWDLEALTHNEPPWKDIYYPMANRVITPEAMRVYYSGVLARSEPHPVLSHCIYTYVEQDEFRAIERALDDETPAPALVEALKKAMLV